METKPLENFATWARRELLTAVDARVTAVLAAGSVARSEQPDAVLAIEREIEKHDRAHVVDRVAYTWFNRIIALRFMDANGYTDAGVVSPPLGQQNGQPEILSDAKHGHLDSAVVTHKSARDAIMGLLDGSRRSTDAEGEAYALLITEYCRHWHGAMPFMFEREGDYTELLVPANLLADGAILTRVREVLSEEVCADVEVIGWLYQFYISERKDEVFEGFKKNKKAGANEIPAATQLFTPHWIVRYLVENSVGRLWLLNRPNSKLAEQMEYYIKPVDEEADYLKISGPEELTVIDPACGSGHMLTYAFDLLYAIYEEEGYAPAEIPELILKHNLFGTEIDPRAGALAAFALTMKARAWQRTFFKKQVKPNICVLAPVSLDQFELDYLWTLTADADLARSDADAFWNAFKHADTFGSLIQPNAWLTTILAPAIEAVESSNELGAVSALLKARRVLDQSRTLQGGYAVAVANPPYMGGSNMNALLSEFAKKYFKDSKSDLFAMFIERSLALVNTHDGLVAMITMQSWMFLSSYEKLRASLLKSAPIVSMAHLGERAFDSIGGAVVSTTGFVLKRGGAVAQRGTFARLVDGNSEAEKSTTLLSLTQGLEETDGLFTRSGADFETIPGSPIAYWLSEAATQAFVQNPPVSEVAEPRQGLATTDNQQFLRRWFEVSETSTGFELNDVVEAAENGRRWFPYNKGGDFRRWYGNQEYVVDWENDGSRIKQSIVQKYPYLNGKYGFVAKNTEYYFRTSVSWSLISSATPAFRLFPPGFIFDVSGMSLFAETEQDRLFLLGLLNSDVSTAFLKVLAPTMNFQVGDIKRIPIAASAEQAAELDVAELVDIAQQDWDRRETSWGFTVSPLLDGSSTSKNLEQRQLQHESACEALARHSQQFEESNNRYFASAYGLRDEIADEIPLERISLDANLAFRFPTKTAEERKQLGRADAIVDFISYAVGCMFGRYSLDEPGLILADQGATLQDYLARVPEPSFMPDADNVIPFVVNDMDDVNYFGDDIVSMFRNFLRTTYGEEHFEENLRFVEDALGVTTLRDYFITKAGKSRFYDDHVQRYKKRPIYWMFSSPKGSFNALIYMHRYTPSTVSTVLNEYLREYRGKLEPALEQAEQKAAAGSMKHRKEADRLRKVILELDEYDRNVLYPLATKQLPIDLDDGVLVNYLRLGPALKNFGLEKDRKKVESWTWPTNPLEPLDA